MKITISLSKNHPEFPPIQASLSSELQQLPKNGIDITEVLAPPPEDALVLGEVVQFIAQNHDTIVHSLPFVTSLVQLMRVILEGRNIRYKKKQKKENKPKGKKKRTISKKNKNIPIKIQVDSDTLDLPCSDQQARSFIKKVIGKQKTDKKVKTNV
jgi:hypothetical protein